MAYMTQNFKPNHPLSADDMNNIVTGIDESKSRLDKIVSAKTPIYSKNLYPSTKILKAASNSAKGYLNLARYITRKANWDTEFTAFGLYTPETGTGTYAGADYNKNIVSGWFSLKDAGTYTIKQNNLLTDENGKVWNYLGGMIAVNPATNKLVWTALTWADKADYRTTGTTTENALVSLTKDISKDTNITSYTFRKHKKRRKSHCQ